ncbi:tetratricopeptide repeat protein [Achromobacter sp.]|jgi:tetratricopeptide (TPR) repeat protein|uniref:tetratricopeptide repeat protein n=1 Tax=Achromobacter sp. TaxID=134375 RepID=UPI0028A78F5E|nr:tetratricopeptide repeat protein [Achromobacter sp.]
MLAALRIRLFSSLLLASVLAGQPAHAQDASQLDDAYLAELRAENDALRARIQQWPPALQAQNAQVSAALRTGNRQEAQRIAEDMARQDPANADVRLFLGKLQGQQGNMAAALALFEQSIALNPDNKWAYVNKAGAQAERADLHNALATTQALTARFPGWSIGYNLQASMLDALNRPDEALDAFEKAVRAKPASALILTNLGNLQRRLGRVADARKSYEAALRLQPGYALTETQLASLPQ